MIILFGFLLPLLLYAFAWHFRRYEWMKRVAPVAAFMVAVWTSIAVLATIWGGSSVSDGNQIAWMGVESTKRSLTIGGNSEAGALGWGNGSFSPELKIAADDSKTLSINAARGNGFLRDDRTGKFITGSEVRPGETKSLGKFSIRISRCYFEFRRCWLEFRSQRMEILDESGSRLADFKLALNANHKVIPLEPLVTKYSGNLRSDAAKLAALEEWAAEIRILIPSEGPLRIVSLSDSTAAKCDLPCDLSVFWSTQRLPFRVGLTEGKLAVNFAPPWRFAGPFPPNEAKDVVFTNQVQPGDYAFALPLGAGADEVRQVVPLAKDGSRKFESTSPSPSSATKQDVESVTSEADIVVGDLTLIFATLRDLPSLGRIFVFISIALFTYAVFLVLCAMTLNETTEEVPGPSWLLYGLSATCWTMLTLRLLLSLRYAQEPAFIDSDTVKGLTMALVGLTLIPGLLLLLSALFYDFYNGPASDDDRISRMWRRIVLLSILTCSTIIQFEYAQTVWKNLPERFGFHLGLGDWTFLILAFVFMCAVIGGVYGKSREERMAGKADFARVLIFPEQFIYISRNVWEILTTGKIPRSWWKALAVFVVTFFILAPWAISKITTGKQVQDVVIPLLLCWLPAAFWLSSGLYTPSEKQQTPKKVKRVLGICAILMLVITVFIIPELTGDVGKIISWGLGVFLPKTLANLVGVAFLALSSSTPLLIFLIAVRRFAPVFWTTYRNAGIAAVVTVFLPVFGIPVVISDIGGIVATLAFFVPIAFILIATRTFVHAFLVSTVLLLSLFTAQQIYANYLEEIPGVPGYAKSRLLMFREGGAAEKYLMTSQVEGTEDVGLPQTRLQNTLEHLWESKAIAYQGQYLGLGFGDAPVRQSKVKQETLRYDSVFPFFILSEHGAVGGFALLVIYCLPLVFALFLARQGFTLGVAVVVIVASAFLFEPLAHAGMNLGVIPFTGRNLSMLSVISNSDLTRWAVLFFIASQAALWQFKQGSGSELMRSSLLADRQEGRKGAQLWEKEGWGRLTWATVCIVLCPILLFCSVNYSMVWVMSNKELAEPYAWTKLKKSISEEISNQTIRLRKDRTPDGQLDLKVCIEDELDFSGAESDSDSTQRSDSGKPEENPEGATAPCVDGEPGVLRTEFIADQARRFNALPIGQKVDGTADSELVAGLKNIQSVDEYSAVVNEARKKSIETRKIRRENIFEVLSRERYDENGRRIEDEYVLRVNPAYGSVTSFNTPSDGSEAPKVVLRGEKNPILGVAWVGGKWASVSTIDRVVPWKNQMKDALVGKWKELGGEAPKIFGTLTLDRNLNAEAIAFASSKGRERFAKKLALKTGASGNDLRLPPRFGIAVISVPDGSVIAMGGYPQTAFGDRWEFDKGSGSWLPTSRWLEERAPKKLRNLYNEDSNFKTVVVGSATKPIWAASVLGVHPKLADQLSTQGVGDTESDVFGIPILQRDWEVATTPWLGFDSYLTRSDNRYQVRLGFLGLAEELNGVISSEGSSSSRKESLSGDKRSVWGRYPKFPSLIRFSPGNPDNITNLQETQLAKSIREKFGVAITGSESGSRFSFWSRAQSDDSQISPFSFGGISPVRTNLALDTVGSPRDFITLLLGGGNNLWSNIDLAGGFATAITGQKVIPHITDGPVTVSEDFKPFPEIARRLRPGLNGVVVSGTASSKYGKVRPEFGTSARAFIIGLQNVGVYAKTGTLTPKDDSKNTSRIVIALIRWDGIDKNKVKKGLVFSVYGEEAETGDAVDWVCEFMLRNRAWIAAYFK